MAEQAVLKISEQDRRSLKNLAIVCGALLVVDFVLIVYLMWGVIFPKPLPHPHAGVAPVVFAERSEHKASPYKRKPQTVLARSFRGPNNGL